MADIYRQTAQTTAPSLTDLIAVYPAAGLSPGAADDDNAAIQKAIDNPPQITTLQALADAVRPAVATTATAGLVELATTGQAREGTDNTRAVTPAGVAAAINRGITGGGVALSLTSLNDTPSALGVAGQYMRVNSDGDAMEFVNQPIPTGAQIVTELGALIGGARLPATAIRDLPSGTFQGLTDTPAAYGTAGQVLAINSDRTGIVYRDAPQGTTSGITRVESDASLSGLGTLASPLSVSNPFTAAEKTKLADITAGAEANVQADWNATSGDALILNKPTIPSAPTAISTRNLLETLSGNDRLPASAIRDLAAGVSAFTALSDTPNSFSGRGGQLLRVNSAGNALEYTAAPNSITTSERSKLALIEPNATADQTGAEMVTAIAALSGNARLPTTALRNGFRLVRGRRVIGTASAGALIPTATRQTAPNLVPGRFYYFMVGHGSFSAAAGGGGGSPFIIHTPTTTTGFNDGVHLTYEVRLGGSTTPETPKLLNTGYLTLTALANSVQWQAFGIFSLSAVVYELDIEAIS